MVHDSGMFLVSACSSINQSPDRAYEYPPCIHPSQRGTTAIGRALPFPIRYLSSPAKAPPRQFKLRQNQTTGVQSLMYFSCRFVQAAIPNGQQQQRQQPPSPSLSPSPRQKWLEKANARRGNGDTLEKTLFVRLAKLGVTPLLLGRQYRCHPRLSALASRLFYQGRYVRTCPCFESRLGWGLGMKRVEFC